MKDSMDGVTEVECRKLHRADWKFSIVVHEGGMLTKYKCRQCEREYEQLNGLEARLVTNK